MSGKEPSPPNSEQLYRQQAQAVLQQIALAADQTVIIARGPQVLVHRGDLKPTEAQDIAAQIAEGWQERGQTARIQFMRLPLLADERLLYTQPLDDDLLLTVVGKAGTPLPRLTRLARQVVASLESAGVTRYNTGS